jgi:hypothetical protein
MDDFDVLGADDGELFCPACCNMEKVERFRAIETPKAQDGRLFT